MSRGPDQPHSPWPDACIRPHFFAYQTTQATSLRANEKKTGGSTIAVRLNSGIVHTVERLPTSSQHRCHSTFIAISGAVEQTNSPENTHTFRPAESKGRQEGAAQPTAALEPRIRARSARIRRSTQCHNIIHPPVRARAPFSPGEALNEKSAVRGNRAGEQARPRSKARSVAAACIGNALEWYDFTIFAIFATYFAGQFFVSDDPVASLLGTLAVFAVGFVMRPLGGLFFGLLADRKGRPFVMMLTISMVAFTSFMIGIVPTQSQVGWLAPVLLLFFRCLQGLAHGGEVGGVYTYVAEMGTPRNRAVWGSLVTFSTIGGTVLATLLAAVMRLGIDREAMAEWGWRVPFILGGVLGVVVIFLRKGLQESEAFSEEQSAEPTTSSSTLKELWASRLSLFRVVIFVGATSVFGYTWSIYAPSYAITFFEVDDRAAMWAGVLANLVYMIALPTTAMIADRVGRRFNMSFWGFGTVVLAFPLFWILDSSAISLLIAMTLALILSAFGAGVSVAWFAELFATKSRATGVGLAVAIAGAIFGGTAPYLNSWLSSIGHSDIFVWYLMALGGTAAVVALFTPETKGISLVTTDVPAADELAEPVK